MEGKTVTVTMRLFLVINQINAEILVFVISLLYASPCFEHYCAHHQEVKILLYNI